MNLLAEHTSWLNNANGAHYGGLFIIGTDSPVGVCLELKSALIQYPDSHTPLARTARYLHTERLVPEGEKPFHCVCVLYRKTGAEKSSL